MFIQFLAKTATCCLLLVTVGCDSSYSTEAILADLSPGMKTLSETHAEYAAGVAVTNNNNKRMLDADWRNILLLDHASTLSVAPVGR